MDLSMIRIKPAWQGAYDLECTALGCRWHTMVDTESVWTPLSAVVDVAQAHVTEKHPPLDPTPPPSSPRCQVMAGQGGRCERWAGHGGQHGKLDG